MILQFITACGLVQLAFYILGSRGEGAWYKRQAIGATMFCLHAAVFPDYFLPEDLESNGCGVPVFATYAVFWIFGIGSAMVIHLLAGLIRN